MTTQANGLPERRKAWQAPAHGIAFGLLTRRPSRFRWATRLKDKAVTELIAQELDTLQNLLRRQALQAAGDPARHGHIGQGRHHPGRVWPHEPLGVHAVGWTAPNEEERAHDYLWRIHQKVPQAGR